MPRYDAHHEAVKRALIKAGWRVTRDQLALAYDGLRVFVDLVAEKQVKSARGNEKIAIEVKVFGKPPFVSEFEKAIGQYSLYRFMLAKTGNQRELYLAVTEKAYQDFFRIPAVQEYTAEQQIYLLIFDPLKEEVLEWIK